MKKIIGALLVFLLGVAILLGGMGYAIITGVAIPDQDPTPAMQQRAAFHMRIVEVGMLSGGGLIALSLLAFCILGGIWIVGKYRPTGGCT